MCSCLTFWSLVVTVCTHLLMELSPSWEPANCTATQELPGVLWNPKVYYCVHMSPPLIPILSQSSPIHPIPFYLSKINLNIVHPPTICTKTKIVRKRTISAERPPLVGEVSSNFFPDRGCCVVSAMVPPVPDPLFLRKYGSARNRTRELWPLDHRGGLTICATCSKSKFP
jgi:hypothetical protein